VGATKKTYFITTKPLEEENFFEWKKKLPFIENWKAEPNDKELFKDDPIYKGYLKDYFKCKKQLENYKFNKRNK